MRPLLLRAKKSPGKGWGVFSAHPLKKGQILERCPLLPLSDKEVRAGTVIDKYWYGYSDKYALAFGFAMLYNHSFEPNVQVWLYEDEQVLEFRALQNIKQGKELFIDYGYTDPKMYPYIPKDVVEIVLFQKMIGRINCLAKRWLLINFIQIFNLKGCKMSKFFILPNGFRLNAEHIVSYGESEGGVSIKLLGPEATEFIESKDAAALLRQIDQVVLGVKIVPMEKSDLESVMQELNPPKPPPTKPSVSGYPAPASPNDKSGYSGYSGSDPNPPTQSKQVCRSCAHLFGCSSPAPDIVKCKAFLAGSGFSGKQSSWSKFMDWLKS